MRLPRFFAPQAATPGSTIDLPAEEAAQLTRVLRLSIGDRVQVFDGRGSEWTATIERASKSGVGVVLGDPITPQKEPRIALTLAIAVLKGDKMDDVVRDAVMLGVVAIQPVVTTRTEISIASLARSGRIRRWQRIAVSSAKQCGRAVVPDVAAPVDLTRAIDGRDSVVMFVEPQTAAIAQPLRRLPPVDRAALLIGPEGGWTDDEVRQAVGGGAMLVTLGTQTLRADAMPMVALAALRAHWDDL